MKYKILLISDAELDLYDIYNFVEKNDSVQNADALLDKLENTIKGLQTFPLRGHTPPELNRISVLDYYEIHYKPYRIIYQVIDKNVYVHCILDGRRDLQDLLEKRLLR